MSTVFTAGYVPLDIVRYRAKRWCAAGGTAGNVAAILAFLGWDAVVAVDLGADAAGKCVVEDLKAAGVSAEFVRLLPDRGTPRLIHEITRTGHRFLFRCPACHGSFPTHRPLTVARADAIIATSPTADVFVFDRCNAGTLLLAEHFAGRGALIVYEPSRPARDAWTKRALSVAHIVKRAGDRDCGLGDVLPLAGQIWITTRGPGGVEYRVGGGRWQRRDAFECAVVDTAGAGDWTTAGLLDAMRGRLPRSRRELAAALDSAQSLAAASCAHPGARGLATTKAEAHPPRIKSAFRPSDGSHGTEQATSKELCGCQCLPRGN